MIIVDTALRKRQQEGNPVRVAMVGAGFIGRGIARQILQSVPGMDLVAIANRTADRALRVFAEAGATDARLVGSLAQLEAAVAAGGHSVTTDPLLVCQAQGIDAIVEVTGAVEHSAHVAVAAIQNRKHLVLMNAELDGTVGCILKVYADRAGVVVTNADGDQPGVIMNLYRFVRGIGAKPVLCGNIKGLHDPYRNPTTQADFARRWGQHPSMVTAAADGSKVAFEMAVVANATGMGVARRGMLGPAVAPGTPVDQVAAEYPLEALLAGNGIVDYIVGADPRPGVFILGTHADPVQQNYLFQCKLGEGPLYTFYTPWHLIHFELPNSVARAVLFADAACAPLGRPCVDVVAAAKADLRAGQPLDGIGGYTAYGLAENAAVSRREHLLPLGLAEGCRLRRDVPKDQVITYDDVDVPEGRLCDQLRHEQDRHFAAA